MDHCRWWWWCHCILINLWCHAPQLQHGGCCKSSKLGGTTGLMYYFKMHLLLAEASLWGKKETASLSLSLAHGLFLNCLLLWGHATEGRLKCLLSWAFCKIHRGKYKSLKYCNLVWYYGVGKEQYSIIFQYNRTSENIWKKQTQRTGVQIKSKYLRYEEVYDGAMLEMGISLFINSWGATSILFFLL